MADQLRTGTAPGPIAECGAIAAELAVGLDRPRLVVRQGGHTVVHADLGLTVDGRALGPGSRIVGSSQADINETYRMYTGKRVGDHQVNHRQLTVDLRTPEGIEWSVIVRVAPDGVALRYRLPAHTDCRLGTEHTRIGLSSSERAWLLEYQTWYETLRFGCDIDALAAGEYGLPALVAGRDGTYVLYTESGIDGTSSGAHLRFDRDGGGPSFTVVAADDPLTVAGGHLTPWRVAIIGTLVDVVASCLVDDLAAPRTDHAPVPTRPGRGAWSWWSSQYSGAYFDVQLRFVQYAAEQAWEHVLVDCGWDETWVPDLVAHASRYGVQVHLWSAWSDLDDSDKLARLERWRAWGVAGIKVDFMESESRERYRWYDAILAETARLGLMVNFHGSVIPRGWARTHPQVVSYEGVRGAEYYVFYGDPLTAAHNVIQPFTRNVVGSMDYTPVTFSAPGRQTSEGHELALAVVFESGITHLADDPAEYRRRPLAEAFLAALAPSWDETRLLTGHPDREAMIARRHGRRWYLGAIATGPARALTFTPSDLVGGACHAWVVADGDDGDGLVERWYDDHPETIEVRVARDGGFVAIVAPSDVHIVPPRRGASAAASGSAAPAPLALPAIEPLVATLGADRKAVITTDAEAVQVEPGWRATRIDGGAWLVSAPPDAAPGTVGIVTATSLGVDGVPVVSHARLYAPYSAGEHHLANLPFLRCRNAVGPVERNQSNGGGDPRDGGPLTVAGTVHPHGLGVSDDSSVSYHLGGAVESVAGAVGIDDETVAARALAHIVVDGARRYTIALVSGQPPTTFHIDVAGAALLELRTEPDPSGERAHVDWIDPVLQIPLSDETGTHMKGIA